jgi:hypothetical protein
MARKGPGKKKGGMRKHGRSKRKALRSGSPISLFVRGKISAEKYFKSNKQVR